MLRADALCMMFIFTVAMLIFSCSGQEINPESISDGPAIDSSAFIRDHYYESERTLVVTPTVDDTLGKSTATISQQATFYHQKTNMRILNAPKLYVYAVLLKQRIDVAKAENLPVTVVKSYVRSRTPSRHGLIVSEDVVKVFELSDGNVLEVYYGWQYTAVILENDTLALPHGEFSSVDFYSAQYEHYGVKTDVEDPYLMRLIIHANLVTKGVSGQQTNQLLRLKPWYEKVISSDPIKVENVSYEGVYSGCPNPVYVLNETVKTNKGLSSSSHRANVVLTVSAPNEREQPSYDSLFEAKSTGKLTLAKVSEIKNEDGFTMRTMSGAYVSSVSGKEIGTVVENTAYVTLQYPIKFESSYGSYDIAPINLSFDELEFKVTKISETDEVKNFSAVNRIQGKLGSCTLDVVDEKVLLRLQKSKPNFVVAVDSVYTLTGDGDVYNVNKEIIWSDGTKTHYNYSYTGEHEAKAYDFGEVVTNSLAWSVGSLNHGSKSQKTEEKKFSDVTKFVAVYTTTDWQSVATCGTQHGTFSFKETVPVVTFVDGKVQKTFAQRSYAMVGLGATLATNYNIVVRDAVSYKAYDYSYKVNATFNGGTSEQLTSYGKLLLTADEVGQAKYEPILTWNGYTATVKVVKTIPHTYAQDEVETFTESAILSLSDLTDKRIDAENTNFKVSETLTESSQTIKNNPWEKVLRERPFNYLVSNGAVVRSDLSTTVKDAVITFNDGVFKHTFDLKLDVTHKENFEGSYRDGDYDVTPLRLTVVATSNGKALQTMGVTNIYVKRAPEEPDGPNLGKPRAFYATATFDPSAQITRRAFVFLWEQGVTYAVCPYETMLPATADFKYKTDTYSGYNSVGYDLQNADHWQPARGSDDADAIRWYYSNGSLMSIIDKNLTCKFIGWKNVVNRQYALVIPGYTYTMDGYNIIVQAPNGATVTFNSHYE